MHGWSRIEEFDSIYRKYAHVVYKVSLHYMRDEGKAQDITVEVFQVFYRYFEEVTPEQMKVCLIQLTKRIIDNYMCD